MTDEQIKAEWRALRPQYDRGQPLGKRLALGRCDALEADGVTEADIDHLFPDQSAHPTTKDHPHER